MAAKKSSEKDAVDFGIPDSEGTKRWVEWCRKHHLVKCTEYDIPDGILPKGYKGTLIDVKVQGKRGAGPDDKIYSANEDLRQKVARGNCVLELHHSSKGCITTEYVFIVFALRKFSGGMGDEDDDSHAVQNMWQNYFIKPVTAASKVVCTSKANGEAAHISCRKIEDTDLFCIGSKNVHLLARNSSDLDKYKDGRFMVAKQAAKAFFRNTLESDLVSEAQKQDLISYLCKYKYTIVAELLQPDYQHVENLSFLKHPELRFICWTMPYRDDESCDTLCAIPPDKGIEQARIFGLQTIEYSVIPASTADDFMTKIRGETGYEGKVLYFMDEDDNVFGLIKKKTSWYILLRAIREKTCYACNPKANITSADITKKMSKRMDEIQTWLGFSDQYKFAWRKLGIGFAEWAVKQKRIPAGGNVNLAIRAQFPVLWQSFLDSHEELKNIYENLTFT